MTKPKQIVIETTKKRGRTPRPIEFKINLNNCHIVLFPKARSSGYPAIRRNCKTWRLHRIIFEKTYGPGSCVMHSCDDKECINPEHLLLGTISDSTKDAVKKGLNCRGEDHGGSKLTTEQVIKIRKSREFGRIIALKFGISKSLASLIRRRERWSWL